MKNISLTNGTDVFTFPNIGNVEGFEYPESRLSIEDVAGDKSAVWINSKAGRRRLSFQSVIPYTSRTNLQKVLKLGNTKTLKFTTCDDIALQTDVDVERFTMPYKPGRQIALLELVSADWRFVSQTEHEYETPETVITGGMGIPATIPFDMAGGEGAASYGVNNAGNDYAEPIFRINGPFLSCIVTNVTTGETFTITDTLASDESIEVNTQDKTILKNETENAYSTMTSGNFWRLAPGFNYIQFTAVGEDVTTILTINWRDSYIGI